MNEAASRENRTQIVVSGVGGQGVLFVTRLLAEAAICRSLPVLTSETHGMAQRGGTVISHLKIGAFASPLIRPGAADAMFVLKEENLKAHAGFVKPGGFTVVNAAGTAPSEKPEVRFFDADAAAARIGAPRAANLVLLGFGLACLGSFEGFYCSVEDLAGILKAGGGISETSAAALSEGFSCGVRTLR